MNDKEIFVYPKNIYVLDAENDSLYISGFSSEAEANETAKCIGARVVNYIREEAAQIAISELKEEVNRLQASELEQQAKGIDWVLSCRELNLSDGEVHTMMDKCNQLRNQAKELNSSVCKHEFVSADNEVVSGAVICTKCKVIEQAKEAS